MSWDRLETSHVTAEFALQRGMSMLDAAVPGDPATLAWWFVDDDALVLGRGSKVSADTVACDAAGVAILRRASGGGPVLWGTGLLAFDVIIPTGHAQYSDDVAGSYRWLGEALSRTITGFGVAARAVQPGEARDAAGPMGALACFASLSPWEVMVDGRKVVGLSQVRRRTGTLLQAGILLDIDGARLAGLLQLDGATRSALTDTLARRATGLRDRADIDRAAFAAALTADITDAT